MKLFRKKFLTNYTFVNMFYLITILCITMFRYQTVIWGLVLWAQVFMYSLLTYLEAKPIYRVIPIIIFLISDTLLGWLISKAASEAKVYLLCTAWSFLVGVALLLRTIQQPNHPDETILKDWHLNLLVTVFSILASLIWCLIGHAKRVTESGLYWYIWSVLTIIAACSAFNNNSSTAIIIYIVNAAINVFAHILYVRHVLKIQTPGQARCRHFFRIMSCFSVTIALLVGSILYKNANLDKSEWQVYILLVEGVMGVVIIIDGFLGFTQAGINYRAVPANDNTV